MPKGIQKSSEILDAILEAKNVRALVPGGRPGGMREGPGEDPPPRRSSDDDRAWLKHRPEIPFA